MKYSLIRCASRKYTSVLRMTHPIQWQPSRRLTITINNSSIRTLHLAQCSNGQIFFSTNIVSRNSMAYKILYNPDISLAQLLGSVGKVAQELVKSVLATVNEVGDRLDKQTWDVEQ